MTALTKIRLHMLAGLLLSASATWGQQLFSDHITGDALSCATPKSYNKRGATIQGYYIHDIVTAPACGFNGAATAKSSATVGPPAITGLSVTTAAKGGDIAAVSAISTDEAILTPPSGWTGPVTVKLETSYTFSVKGGTSTTPGAFSIDWVIDDVLEKTVSSTSNGNGTLNVSFPIVVDPRGDGAYEISVSVDGVTDTIAGPKGGPSASFKTSFIDFGLPKGWTCSWASNRASCEAP